MPSKLEAFRLQSFHGVPSGLESWCKLTALGRVRCWSLKAEPSIFKRRPVPQAMSC